MPARHPQPPLLAVAQLMVKWLRFTGKRAPQHVDLTKVAEYTAEAAKAGGPGDGSLGMLWHKLSELPTVFDRQDPQGLRAGLYPFAAMAWATRHLIRPHQHDMHPHRSVTRN